MLLTLCVAGPVYPQSTTIPPIDGDEDRGSSGDVKGST